MIKVWIYIYIRYFLHDVINLVLAYSAAFEALSEVPDKNYFPHAYRWAVHVAALLGTSVAFKGSAAPSSAAPPAVAAKAPAAADDLDC